MSLIELRSNLNDIKNPEKVQVLQRFFKTGKGQYGEGDIFLGITVPESRKIAIKYSSLELIDIKSLLQSKIHEERLIALLILVHRYNTNIEERKNIFYFYLDNTNYINNWDLVDLSSHQIIGDFLKNKDRKILYQLVKSSNLWERRISIISTYAFIRNNNFEDTLKISEILLNDEHDLIQKAVGWMLREVGNRNMNIEEEFLKKHYKSMPRTMLRYAIEKFPENKRRKYLNGKI